MHKNPPQKREKRKKISQWRRTWRFLKMVVEESLYFGAVPFALCYAHVYLHRKHENDPWYAFLAPWRFSSSSSSTPLPWWATVLYSGSYELSPAEFFARASRYAWHCSGGLSQETLKATFFAHYRSPEVPTTPYSTADPIHSCACPNHPSTRSSRGGGGGEGGALGWGWQDDGARLDPSRVTPTTGQRLREWWGAYDIDMGKDAGKRQTKEETWKKWSPLFSSLFFHAHRFHLFMNVLTWVTVYWESRHTLFYSPSRFTPLDGKGRKGGPAASFHLDTSTDEAEEEDVSVVEDEVDDGAVSGEREKREEREPLSRDGSTSFHTMPTTTPSFVWDEKRRFFWKEMTAQVMPFVVGGILGGHGGAWLWRHLVFSRHWRLLCHAAASPSRERCTLPEDEAKKWWKTTVWWDGGGTLVREGEGHPEGVGRSIPNGGRLPASLHFCRRNAWRDQEKHWEGESGGSLPQDILHDRRKKGMWRWIEQPIPPRLFSSFSFFFAWLFPPYVRSEREGEWDGMLPGDRSSHRKREGLAGGHARRWWSSSALNSPPRFLPSVGGPVRTSPQAKPCFSYLLAEQRTFETFAESLAFGASGGVMAYNGWCVGRWCRAWIAASRPGREIQEGRESALPNAPHTRTLPVGSASTVSRSHPSASLTPTSETHHWCGGGASSCGRARDGGRNAPTWVAPPDGGAPSPPPPPPPLPTTHRWRRRHGLPVPLFSLSLATREVLLFTSYVCYLFFGTSIPTDVEPCLFTTPKTLLERLVERCYGCCAFFPPSPVHLIRSLQWIVGLWWRQEGEVGVWSWMKEPHTGAGAVSCASHMGGLVVGFLLGFLHG